MKKVRKLLLLGLAILTVAGLIQGGTFAWLTDTEAVQNNSLTAGTLDLKVDGSGTTVPFTFENIFPGDQGNYTWNLHNVGTGDGRVYLQDIELTESNLPTNGDEIFDGTADLASKLNVVLIADWDSDGVVDSEDNEIYSGVLKDMPTRPALDPYLFSHGLLKDHSPDGLDIVSVILRWDLPSSTGNEVQGDSAKLSLTFKLTQ
jgi:predicted ribosomally synthesized peptide with SipW-like signal peptide